MVSASRNSYATGCIHTIFNKNQLPNYVVNIGISDGLDLADYIDNSRGSHTSSHMFDDIMTYSKRRCLGNQHLENQRWILAHFLKGYWKLAGRQAVAVGN